MLCGGMFHYPAEHGSQHHTRRDNRASHQRCFFVKGQKKTTTKMSLKPYRLESLRDRQEAEVTNEDLAKEIKKIEKTSKGSKIKRMVSKPMYGCLNSGKYISKKMVNTSKTND